MTYIVISENNTSVKAKSNDYDVCPDGRYWNDENYHSYMQHYGKHFSRNLAKWAVSNNVWSNIKGSGEYWTCEQVETALKGMGVMLTEQNKYDAYYLANSMYSDHASATMTDTMILQLVVNIMKDKDGYEGMIFDSWIAKAMGMCWSIDWEKMK